MVRPQATTMQMPTGKRKGGASLAPYHDFEKKLPPKVLRMVAEKQREILDGRFTVPVNEKVPVSN